MNFANKIVKNSMSNSMAFFIEAITAFLMMPFVILHLGDSSYGIWVLINAMTGYLGLFKLGFRPSINKHVAEYKATKDFGTMRDYIGASLHIYIYVSVAILVTTLMLSYFVPSIFDIDNEFILIFQILILFSGLQSVVSLVGTAYGGVISGYQRYEINAGIEIFVILIRAGLILYFLPEFDSLYTMAAAHFSLTIIGHLVTIAIARNLSPIKNLAVIKKPGKEILSVIIKYNSVSFLIAGIGIIISFVDTFIVGLILPLAVITHYTIGDRLVKYTISFISVATRVIAPAISELKATNNDDKAKGLIVYTHKVSCIMSYPVLLCLVIQGADFIKLWMGNGYSDSAEVMVVLALVGLIIAPSQVITPFLYGLGKHKYLLYFLIIEISCSVPLSYLLGVEYGIIGVAVGLSVPRAILRGLILPVALNSILKIKIAKSMFSSQLMVLVGSIPYIALLLYFKDVFVLNSWLIFFVQLILAVLVYMISMYLFVISKTEKTFILNKLLNKKL